MLSRASSPASLRVGIYFGALFLAGNFASPIGVPLLPIQFFLKDRLHLSAQDVTNFSAITGIPLVLGFLFGFLRDRWRPQRLGDRGYLLLASPLLLLAYLLLAFGRPVYERLLLGYLLAILLYRFLYTPMQALTTVVAQRLLMTGRLSALWNIIANVPLLVSYVAGGWLARHWSLRGVFLLCAAMAVLTFLAALWEAPEVHAIDETDPVPSEGGLRAIRRLVRHRPLWPAALIWCLWNFSPGFQTPSFFYLTNTVKLSEEQFGVWKAIFFIGLMPTFVLYGVLCQRLSLRRLLWLSAITAVPQMIPLLYSHTLPTAMISAVIMGLIGGLPGAAYWDLVIRSCPKGLEGTGVMLADSGFYLAIILGDLVGVQLYQWGGFLPNVVAMTITYALILVVLPFVPRYITADREEDASGRGTSVTQTGE